MPVIDEKEGYIINRIVKSCRKKAIPITLQWYFVLFE
jgi:hypothetical protein